MKQVNVLPIDKVLVPSFVMTLSPFPGPLSMVSGSSSETPFMLLVTMLSAKTDPFRNSIPFSKTSTPCSR